MPELDPLSVELLKRLDLQHATHQQFCKEMLSEVRGIRKALKLADEEEIAAQKAWRTQIIDGIR